MYTHINNFLAKSVLGERILEDLIIKFSNCTSFKNPHHDKDILLCVTCVSCIVTIYHADPLPTLPIFSALTPSIALHQCSSSQWRSMCGFASSQLCSSQWRSMCRRICMYTPSCSHTRVCHPGHIHHIPWLKKGAYEDGSLTQVTANNTACHFKPMFLSCTPTQAVTHSISKQKHEFCEITIYKT